MNFGSWLFFFFFESGDKLFFLLSFWNVMKHKVKLIQELLFYITSQMILPKKVILAVSKYQYQEQGRGVWMLLLTVDPQGGRDVGPAAKVCVLKGKNVLPEWGIALSPMSFVSVRYDAASSLPLHLHLLSKSYSNSSSSFVITLTEASSVFSPSAEGMLASSFFHLLLVLQGRQHTSELIYFHL